MQASDLLQQPAIPEIATPERNALAQLAMLHDEARETAMLANLLGRALYAACALAGLALVTAGWALAQVSPAPLAAWLVLVAIAAGAIAHAYNQTIKAPFELAPLRSFSKDLSAIMLYAGFAWGAGAFLVIPVAASPAALLFFSAGTCVVIAALLRSREHALLFLAPVAGLSALAPLMHGRPAGLGVLVVSGVLAGLIYAAGRLLKNGVLPEISRISVR
jgi:hypothetical protein